MSMFEPKYQGKALELLNKWISAKSKSVWVKDHFNPTVNDESSEEAKAIAEKYTQNVKNADEIFEYLHKFPSKDNTKQTTLF